MFINGGKLQEQGWSNNGHGRWTRVEIEPLTGEFPAVTNPQTGEVTQTIFDVGGGDGGAINNVQNSLKQAYSEAVNLATQRYGGNVTVQRNGIDLFRVHQTNSGHGFNVTQFKNSHVVNPKTGLPFRNNIDVPVRATHLKQLQKALEGIGNYSIRTRGGR